MSATPEKEVHRVRVEMGLDNLWLNLHMDCHLNPLSRSFISELLYIVCYHQSVFRTASCTVDQTTLVGDACSGFYKTAALGELVTSA